MENNKNVISSMESILWKANQLCSVSLIAQEGKIEELYADRATYLFVLMTELSTEIISLAEDSLTTERTNA